VASIIVAKIHLKNHASSAQKNGSFRFLSCLPLTGTDQEF